MNVFKLILIILLFLSLAAGLIMVIFAKPFSYIGSKKANYNQQRQEVKIKLIGYILCAFAFALAMFQGLIK